MAYRVLTFDGGGIRAYYSLQILKRIIEKRPNFLEKVHCYGGTSSGALLAGILARSESMIDIERTSDKYIDEIFKVPWYQKPFRWKGILLPKYHAKTKTKVLKEIFTEKKIEEYEKDIVITAFDSKRFLPVIFSNLENRDYIRSMKDIELYRAIDYSMAAPVYFGSKHSFVDGGVFSNNPSSTLAGFLSNDGREKKIISIGNLDFKNPENCRMDMGLLTGGINIIDYMLQSSELMSTRNSEQILKDNYYRIDKETNLDIKLDDVDRISEVIQLANETEIDFEKIDDFLK